MKLQEFIEKFLPSCKEKMENEQDDIMWSRILFNEEYFPEALQNFINKMCEKQRNDCFCAYKSNSISIPQPTAEEL